MSQFYAVRFIIRPSAASLLAAIGNLYTGGQNIPHLRTTCTKRGSRIVAQY
jgi:hypothetical protein